MLVAILCAIAVTACSATYDGAHPVPVQRDDTRFRLRSESRIVLGPWITIVRTWYDEFSGQCIQVWPTGVVVVNDDGCRVSAK